jgi:hypothetical protein
VIEFLRNLTPVWQFSAVILAFVGVVLTILNRVQHPRKALSYETVYHVTVASVAEIFQERVKVLLDDKPVQNAHLFFVRILNSGDSEIKAADYDHPVYISFGEKAQILQAGISEKKPEDVAATIKIEDQKVVLTPVNLNSGDSVEVLTLVNQFEKLKVGGHIIGIKEIKELSEEMRTRSRPLDIIVIALFIIPIVGLFLVELSPLVGFSKVSTSTMVQYMIAAMIVMLADIALMFYGMVHYPMPHRPTERTR